MSPKEMLRLIEAEQLKSLLPEMWRNLLFATFIILFALVFSRLAKKWLAALLNRSRVRDDLLLKNFFVRSLTLSVYLLAVLSALDTIGLQVRTFIAGLGVTGLILGFGLRDTLSNFAAGLLLLIYRPFRAGELIEVEGSKGVVEELTIVNMQMTTTDGVRVIMPNSKVWGAKITNYSLSQRRRLELTVKVREDCTEDGIEAILSALKNDGRVLTDPPPVVQVSALYADSTDLTIWLWTTLQDHTPVKADIYLKVLIALRRAEIQIF
ncbi:MAG: mechanosensitive ion channel family protein [Blastocatellia bacterium]